MSGAESRSVAPRPCGGRGGQPPAASCTSLQGGARCSGTAFGRTSGSRCDRRPVRRRSRCLAVLALALGIGANSAVFSVVNGVLLRPLPYQEPERLVMVWSDNRNEGRALNVVSPANFADYRDRSRSFAAMDYAVSFMMRLTVKGEEDAPPTWALRTGSDLFNVLGRQAMLGRVYTTGERRVAVVSHDYWTNRLGSDRSAIGRSLTLVGQRGRHDRRRDAARLRVPISVDVRALGLRRRGHRRHVDSDAAGGQPLGDAGRKPDSERALARGRRPAGAGRVARTGPRRPRQGRSSARGRVSRIEPGLGHDGRVADGSDRRQCQTGAAHHAGGRRTPAADGGRERGQPGPGAQRRAATRARGSRGARRLAAAAGAAVAHRKHHPRARRSGARPALRALGSRGAGRRLPRSTSRACGTCRPIRASSRLRWWWGSRPACSSACCPLFRARAAMPLRPCRITREAPSGPGRGAACVPRWSSSKIALAVVLTDRRRPADSQLRAADERRPWLPAASRCSRCR